MATINHFPIQNIPDSQKHYDWVRDNVRAIVDYHDQDHYKQSEHRKDYENYMIVNGEFDRKQFEYLTDMYGLTAPARLVNYPLIFPKIDGLAGELISQPLRFSVDVTNRDAIQRKVDQKVTVAAEVILRPIRRETEQMLGQRFEDADVGMEVPQNVEEFMKMKFRDVVEDMVQIGLTDLIRKYDLEHVFKSGFYDMGIVAKEFYEVVTRNGDPVAERVDPRNMIYDPDSNSETLEHSQYAGRDDYYTIAEIIDRSMYWGLTREDIEYIEWLARQEADYFEQYSRYYRNYAQDDQKSLKVRVCRVQWKSIRMIRYKVSPNKFDPTTPFYKMVPDDYEAKKGEKITELPINDVWKATQIGHEKIVDWGRRPNQIRYEDNYANTELDFYGVIKNNINNSTISITDSLKNLQMLYNIVMYHMELTLSRAGGKAVVYDMAQKPKNMSYEDVMWHAKNSGFAFINSKQEGMQGMTYNQFSQVDFTMSNLISQLINMKIMIEETAERLTGVTDSRMGISKSSDAVGVNERSIVQSTLVTQPLFQLHYKIVNRVLQAMANKMGLLWQGQKRMAYIYGDVGMQYFEIVGDMVALDQFGIHIENYAKEAQDKQTMITLLDRYASSGNIDPLTAIKTLRKDTASEMERTMEVALEGIRAQQAEMQEREVAAQEAKNEIDAAKVQSPIQVAQIRANADIEVAKIRSASDADKQARQIEQEQDMSTFERNKELDMEAMRQAGQETQNPIMSPGGGASTPQKSPDNKSTKTDT